MTRSLNVMPKTTLRSGESEASVTIIKDTARVIILLRVTTDGHKASRGLSAIEQLFVMACQHSNADSNIERFVPLPRGPLSKSAYANVQQKQFVRFRNIALQV